MQKRAERAQATRQRIVDAAVDLHRTVGLSATLSAIAERAGVQRHTLYSYFPDIDSLFQACRAHFLVTHPPPDPRQWRAIEDPAERTALALDELYAYYEAEQEMIWTVYRDADRIPVERGFEPFVRQAADVVAEGWIGETRGDKTASEIRAAVALAVDFFTWRQLVDVQGIGREQAVEIMASFIACVSGGDRRQ